MTWVAPALAGATLVFVACGEAGRPHASDPFVDGGLDAGPVILDDAGYQIVPSNPAAPEGFVWRLPVGFPAPVVPEGNPMSDAKVELGRQLFYDRRLSASQQISCATCHQQRAAFADARGVSRNADGTPHPRNAPSLANAGYHARYDWASPALETLEQQLRGPLFGENAPITEMGLDTEARRTAALARLLGDDRYVRAFAAAFPGQEPSPERIIDALACFLRTVVSGNAPVDRYDRGELTALSEEELFGKTIFETHYGGSVCHHCHSGVTLSNEVRHTRNPLGEFAYTNVGLYDVDGTGSYPLGNQGLFEATGNPNDRGKFRTPTVRNVAVTAPYMHDGSVSSLRAVIDHYQEGGRNVTEGPHRGDGRKSPLKEPGIDGMILEEHEVAALEAFLRAYTDPMLLSDPRYANPFPGDPRFGE